MYPNPEESAQRLLIESGVTSPPVRLADVAKHWCDVQVTFEDIEGDAFLVDLGVLGTNILVKKKARRERQRFSLAHEFGHLALAEKGIPISESLRATRHEKIERWCNWFASELLMPREWFCQEVDGSRLDDLYEGLSELAQKYEVSNEAVLIRLTEVTPINVLRISKTADTRQIRTNTSKEQPLRLRDYEGVVLDAIQRGNSVNDFLATSGVYCVVRAQRKSTNREDWIVLLSQVENGLTIKCDRRSRLRR